MSQGIEETQFWAQISEPVATAILEQLCQEKDYPTLVYLMKINPQFKKLCPCFDHFKIKERPEDEPELDFDNPNELAEQLRSGVSPNQLYKNETHLYIYLWNHMHNNNAYCAYPEDERNMIKTIVKYGGIAHPKLSQIERMMLHHILSHDANSQDGVDIIRKYLLDQGKLRKWHKFWDQISDSVKSQIIKSSTLEQVKNVLNENNLLSLLPPENISPRMVANIERHMRLSSRGFNVFVHENIGEYKKQGRYAISEAWNHMNKKERELWEEKARKMYEPIST
jgi:hypothetical protein